jgi:predicted secreted hydrolase
MSKARSRSRLIGLWSGLLFLGCLPDPPAGQDRLGASLDVTEILGGEPQEGFERAMERRSFSFPEDHGPHPGFRTEWWYLTGNLEGPRGEPFGFQLTFFRSALGPEEDLGSDSVWRTNQVYMAHFALTDGRGSAFHSFERFARPVLGLAGAEIRPFRVWVEDWEIRGPDPGGGEGEAEGIFPLHLRAEEAGVGLRLALVPEKPYVLQGDGGLSQKGPEAGNASYYYSFTRLRVSGSVFLEGDSIEVRGRAWLDREWSTSALSEDQVGWDWFALQLEDGHDLMVYQLRGADGTVHPLSEGIWVDAEGATVRIREEEVFVEVLESWSSPMDGTPYPGEWRLSIPRLALDLTVTPLIPDQEMALTFRYWEGAVRVEGLRRGIPVRGAGYVELTGYTPTEGGDPGLRGLGGTGEP